MTRQLSLLALTLLSSATIVACEIGDGDDNHIDDDTGGMGGTGDGDGDGSGGTSATGGLGGMGMGGGTGSVTCELPALPAETIDIAGSYTDETQGLEVTITTSSWDTGFTFHHLSEVGNETADELGYAVALNDADDVFFPCLWSLFMWQEVDGTLYYCQVAFDEETEFDAATVALDSPPDEADLAEGCNGSPWNELTPN